MQIGIFAKTFVRPTLKETLDAVTRHGIYCVQFNFACVGMPSLPDRIDWVVADRIREQMEASQVSMAAVSGTFNMAHPNPAVRRDGLARLRELACSCKRLDTSIVTLCTGTRDPENMWRRHPDNGSPQAWRDLLVTMGEAVKTAEETGVTLAFEPEVSNVVDSAQKARSLLDEVRSPRLKVVMDAANLFQTGELPRMRPVLDEAFELLHNDIVLAHAKDLNRDGEAGHEAAGQGVLDYDHYLALLRTTGFDGPLILHGLTEIQVEACVAFLHEKLGRRQEAKSC